VTDPAFRPERATSADLDAILAIAVASFASPWSRASHAEELARPAGACWVVRASGCVLGYLLGRLEADELHVLSLAVAPPDRRSGCAAALIGVALGDACARGARRAHLEVRASARPALACYRDAGFEVVGRRPNYYPGGEDALLLTRVLAPLDAPSVGGAASGERLAREGR
jgi:ribosomal-protein-alanine N-acetyltransferase